jgi:hypothetical protein
MNAIAESITTAPPRTRQIAERQIFVFMAAMFVALTLAGFVPSSLAKIAAVQSGQRPPFPPVLHVHAALMGAWLLLLLAQSALIAGGRRVMHRSLGLVGALLLPAIVVSGVLLIGVTWSSIWGPAAAASMPPDVLAETRIFISNVLLMQGRALILFPVFVIWALLVRRRDRDAHTRLMFLGTAVPLVAGLDRLGGALGWTTLPGSPLALDLYMLASVLPLLVWDLRRHRQVHYTTRVWLAANLPLAVATNLLWNSDWWLATAPRLAGVG